MSADAATIRSTVEAYCAAFSAGDRAAYVALFADDAWIEDPVGSPRLTGHDAIGGFFDQSRSLADSIELRQTGPVRVAAGECAFPMQARPDLGGTTMVVDIIDVMTFADDGRITTMRAFWDPAEMRLPRTDGVAIPARLSIVTLGVRDMAAMRAFYKGLGWPEQPGAGEQFASYLVGGVLLALYGLDDLAQEAAPGEPLTKHGWGGHTFALNVDERDEVDDVVRAMVAAGARKVGQVVDRPWGGRSGYVADPEGNRWEVAWAPGLRFDQRGAVLGIDP